MRVPDGLVGIIEGSLLPEVERLASDRSRLKVETGKGEIIINIEATDISALRAALNSYLRWVNAVLDVIETVSDSQKG
ncbi:MAG: KEOPS complex subunit Pcc1 [Candidatus Bathyarchaeota archaeon]|jgi:tRNA threonylcarbamoyladenosine modification (KEOPS) complex  Pcc1 subunit